MDVILALPSVLQALLATAMTYLLTAAGAALVLLVRHPRRAAMDAMLAAGAGIMLASSFWSLLSPAISLSSTLGQTTWLVVSLGFLLGAAFIILGDVLDRRLACSRGAAAPASRSRLLIAAITLHNIPEGLAVGVAFGALAVTPAPTLLRSAWLLALGIGIQNFPEGAAVSMPLLRDRYSPRRAFFYGQLSGFVEPAAGLVGAVLAATVQGLLPFMLAFAGGAMVYVVLAELVPENCGKPWSAWLNLATMLGFVVMMVLDISFG